MFVVIAIGISPFAIVVAVISILLAPGFNAVVAKSIEFPTISIVFVPFSIVFAVFESAPALMQADSGSS